jgi:acyl-CoA synthetase (AMP-forming)/AMP-acid ligase II
MATLSTLTSQSPGGGASHLPVHASGANGTLVDEARLLLEQSPDKTMVIEGDRTMTVRQVWDEAEAIVRFFQAKGLRQGDVIAMQLPNWAEAFSVYLAASMLGLVLNPILPILRDNEVRFILKDSRSRLIFIPSAFRGFAYHEMLKRVRADLPELDAVVVLRGDAGDDVAWTDVVGDIGAAPELEPIDPHSVKIVMYTSGTTGRPKGVLHTHATLRAEIESYVDFWNMREDDVVFMASPISHIGGCVCGCELPWALGAPVVLQDKWAADEAVDLIAAHNATFTTGSTPFLVELLKAAKAKDEHLPNFRRFTCGGMAVPPQLIRDAHAWFTNTVVGRAYGMSEVPTISLSIATRDDIDNGADTDGRIPPDVQVRLVDLVTGEPIGVGQEGEILVKAREQFVGYLRAEDNEGAYDADGFFRTGDIGILTDQNCLAITGRKKDLIIRGGENISAREIEDILITHPALADVAIAAFPHPRMGEGVGCFVVLKDGASFDQPQMVAFLLEAALAKQKIPERLEFIDALPRNDQGKVQKNLLREKMKALCEAEA